MPRWLDGLVRNYGVVVVIGGAVILLLAVIALWDSYQDRGRRP